MALPPAVRARLVDPDGRPGHLLLQPRPHRRARAAGALHDADPLRRVGLPTLRGRRHPADRVAAARALRQPVPAGERPALVRRLLHHRLRQPLPDRADHRRGAVGPQARGVAALDAPLRRRSTSAPWSATSSTRWRRRGWPPRRATSTRPSRGSPAAAGATSAWAASTWSSRASATRSPRCPRCTPASPSWWRCTASGGCARRCDSCSCSTRSPCPRRSSTTASTTSSTCSPAPSWPRW